MTTSALRLLALLLVPSAYATEDGNRILGPSDDGLAAGAPALPPEERYARTRAVLAHFGLDPEQPQPGALAAYELAQTAAGAARILATLDPARQFSLWFEAAGTSLTGFLDGGAKRVPDFQLGYAATDGSVRPTGLVERFRRAARGNPAGRPLAGLKIAFDPGHMGTDLWDERTGKFVTDAKGGKLSEGLLNLQTSLLAGQQLAALGAEVVYTHSELGPVYGVPYEKLSLGEWGRRELRLESLQPWFQALLATGTGEKLNAAFEASPSVKKLFSEFQRINYFMLRADLDARAQFLRAAAPDLTVIVHYDTGSGTSHVNPKPLDGTKAYVAGAFEPGEFATQRSRTGFARKLADREGWDASLLLGRSVVRQLAQDLGIGYSKGGGGTSFQFEPGIFARNLGIPSQLDGQAVTYVEVLDYDDPNEFRQLRQYTRTLKIGATDTPYSDRLATAASAIAKGVRAFVAGYATPEN